MSNVIEFRQDNKLKGEAAYEELIRTLVNEEEMDRGILMSMNKDGVINMLIAGELLTSEAVYMTELLKQAVLTDNYE